MSAVACRRCGEPAETRDNVMETTFWGQVVGKVTEVTTTRWARIRSTMVRGRGSVTRSDEEVPLCSPCWGLFVGRFLHGRDIAALDHEHAWRKGREVSVIASGVHIYQCSLCYKTRIGSDDA